MADALKTAAPIRALDHDHQSLRGAGPSNYEEALEAEIKVLKRAIATFHRDAERKRADYIRWCQGAGHVDALLGFVEFYKKEST